MVTFGGNFRKIGRLFIPVSGHTACFQPVTHIAQCLFFSLSAQESVCTVVALAADVIVIVKHLFFSLSCLQLLLDFPHPLLLPFPAGSLVLLSKQVERHQCDQMID